MHQKRIGDNGKMHHHTFSHAGAAARPGDPRGNAFIDCEEKCGRR
jgi:hypothetical protein